MTPDQIERKAERMMDHLDRLLLSGDLSQNDYDVAVRELDRWTQKAHQTAQYPSDTWTTLGRRSHRRSPEGEAMTNAWGVTEAEYRIAREREANTHYSPEDRADYFQLMRFYCGQVFYRDAAERAAKRVRSVQNNPKGA